MNRRLGGRCSAFLILLLLAILAACGGNNNSTANNGNNSGNTGSGGNTGGANTGNGGPGGSSSAGNTFVYAGGYADQGSIFGFKLDSGAGTLTQISGSPWVLPNGSATGGAVAVKNGFVYVANQPSSTSGGAIYTYKVDGPTGQLTQQGNAVVVTSAADPGIRTLIASRTGNVLYAITQSTVYLVSVNGGTPSVVTQQTAGDVIWGFAETANAVYVGVQNGSPKSGFQQPVIERMASTGSLGSPSVVATLSDANIPFALATDQSGRYLAATTGMNSQNIAVFAIGSSGSLTPVSGSPFSANARTAQKLMFDPSGQYLYVVTNEEPVPNQESVIVFSVGNGGTLTQVQLLDLPSDVRVGSLVVRNDLVFVVNDAVSGPQGSITVLRRNASNGQLTVVGTTNVNKPLSEVDVASF